MSQLSSSGWLGLIMLVIVKFGLYPGRLTILDSLLTVVKH